MANIASYLQDLTNGTTTVRKTVEGFLARIEETKNLNAFLEVFADEALTRADEIDQKIAAGQAGKLAGVVVGVKDNICIEGHKVSASSRILEGFESLYSATAVEKLLAEDAIIIGRLNCDEFAMGSSNENSYFGNALNPIDNERVPGGSSGGSAVAVAAGLCHVSLGSETGGSVRQPASFCGIVGVKPTYGRVSRHGLLAFASSFDQIGSFANNVEDAALLLEVISGTDEFDSTSSSKPVGDLQPKSIEKKKFAYLKECVENEALDPSIRESFMKALEALKAEGHQVEAVDFPMLDHLIPTYYVLTTAEASSNLSRYDGMRYGYRSDKATDLESTYKLSRSEGFGTEVKRRIMLGTFVLSAGYYDAYYGKAQKVRRLLKETTNKIFSEYDFILSPTTPDVAFKFGENTDDPIKMYLEDIYTVMANLTGIPAVSIPLAEKNGLPFGIQVMANEFQEQQMFSAAKLLSGKGGK
ncbi:MAG: Asp-tRNA(Asn)/Glu-tRNA(Gln) amidotransferase subunit GatA [Flavobacteriales bacterium]|nr:Asp-tRNA(Asn)/Glu-tRNA(Gln) amidotransferase subunit GatA [Flavobacteriales bacterium]MCB9191764.1 Asp-tRNA(Asn)/Glu-tRNA(Gln) amidotransferase subunit GatA [Flavobacteriales bacterium]MCB9203574.1 Asp-tRNA(Asn)/Glu-tRNA(Gln) amidotransferase subunit GatA [Flavobacteriales bacterium]